MARFVVLEHTWRGVHWDFMLERGSVLRTWVLDQPPDVPGPLAARPSFDHRTVYLDYEGPVSQDRGVVRRWDGGTYELIGESAEGLEIELCGTRLRGRVRIERHEPLDRWGFCTTTSGAAGVPDPD